TGWPTRCVRKTCLRPSHPALSVFRRDFSLLTITPESTARPERLSPRGASRMKLLEGGTGALPDVPSHDRFASPASRSNAFDLLRRGSVLVPPLLHGLGRRSRGSRDWCIIFAMPPTGIHQTNGDESPNIVGSFPCYPSILPGAVLSQRRALNAFSQN